MCDNSFGGITGDMYATPFNTIGIGDVMPCGMNGFGSGDRMDNILTSKNKKKKQNNISNNQSTTIDMNPPLIVYTKKG